jgi:hypothetical protein
MARVFGGGRRAGVLFGPQRADSRPMRSDGCRSIRGARASLGPGGKQLSRPRPRLRPGARGSARERALTVLGRGALGRFGPNFGVLGQLHSKAFCYFLRNAFNHLMHDLISILISPT